MWCQRGERKETPKLADDKGGHGNIIAEKAGRGHLSQVMHQHYLLQPDALGRYVTWVMLFPNFCNLNIVVRQQQTTHTEDVLQNASLVFFRSVRIMKKMRDEGTIRWKETRDACGPEQEMNFSLKNGDT